MPLALELVTPCPWGLWNACGNGGKKQIYSIIPLFGTSLAFQMNSIGMGTLYVVIFNIDFFFTLSMT